MSTVYFKWFIFACLIIYGKRLKEGMKDIHDNASLLLPTT